MSSVNEEKAHSIPSEESQAAPTEKAAPSWEYVETKLSAFVQCGIVYRIEPHWNGPGDTKRVQEIMKLAAAAPSLYAALKAIKDAAQPILRDPENTNTFAMWAAKQASDALVLAESN